MEDKFTINQKLQGTYTFLAETVNELNGEYARQHRYYHNLDHIHHARSYLEKNIVRFAKEYYPEFYHNIDTCGALISKLLTERYASIEDQICLYLGRPVGTDELVELAKVCTAVVYLHVKLVIALYFHDAVYYTDIIANRFNEQRSAKLFLDKAKAKQKDWASRGLEKSHFMSEEEILEIYNAILDTKNYAQSKYGLSIPAFNRILEDCDLSIFEQDSNEYLSPKLQDYESLIRLEYGHFSDEAYYVKRVWFLINLHDAQTQMIRRNGISALISHILENANCVYNSLPISPGSYADQWSGCIEAWRYRQL